MVAHPIDLWMGTAALSERDYVHTAIDQADLIIAIGHDTVEKPPFIMGAGGPTVIHVGYSPANVEEVYFPQAAVVGDVGPSLSLLADRLEGELPMRRRCCRCGRVFWPGFRLVPMRVVSRRRRSVLLLMCVR